MPSVLCLPLGELIKDGNYWPHFLSVKIMPGAGLLVDVLGGKGFLKAPVLSSKRKGPQIMDSSGVIFGWMAINKAAHLLAIFSFKVHS